MAKELTYKLNLKVDGKEVVKNLTVDMDELQKAIGETKGVAEKFTSSLIKWNQTAEVFQNISNCASQLASTFNNLTDESVQFDEAMSAANTMAGKSGDDFDYLKDRVAELSKTIPIARDALANGLYQVVSNGVPEDNWISYLEQSAKASVGGIADLGETVKVTSTIIKNYGLSWDAAGDIQDKIQLTAKNGVTSFEQLAQALPRVTSQAATLGVSVDELMATFSTLTGVSGNTAEVSTQLAAIFTALIKPSSEAIEMAQQMGIQFDAAAIKASGGMSNFIAQLDRDVKSYAQSSGMLEEEIYGRLFGSAESLRALTPLTTKLADKFQENIVAMSNSVGTISDSFDTMVESDSAKLQLLQNRFGTLTDFIQSAVGSLRPYVNIGSQVVSSLSSIAQLAVAMQSLGIATKLISGVSAVSNRIRLVSVSVSRLLLAALRGETVGATTAAVATRALSLAIKGLLISTGVGVAVLALASAFNYLSGEEEKVSAVSEEVLNAEKAGLDASARMQATLAEETSSLRALIQSKKDTSVAIQQLNEKYGEVFGNHQTAAAWYDVLTQKSQAYVRQIGYEAQARELSVLLAKKEMELEANNDARKKLWQSGKAQARVVNQISGTSSWGSVQNYSVSGMADTAEYVALKKHGAALVSSISELREKLNIATGKVAEFGAQLNTPERGGIKSTASVAGGSGSVGTPRTTPQAVKSATKGSIDWYEQELRELRSKISSTADESVAKGLQSQYKETESALEALKVRLGISVDTTGVQEQLDAASDHLTITADVEPEVKDVTKGSRWDKRMSYSNAESRAHRIQQDYEIGVIDKETAAKEIEALNRQLQKLGDGLKPIELHVDEKSVEAIRSLGHIDLTNMDSVLSSIKNLKQVTDPTAKGFATAGASCEALGSALQQLGGDSEAAKAGLVMAAIGNLVLSFSQALASCKTWIEWLAFGISGAAQLTNLIGMISGFATGGIVPGSQRQGDKVLVRVNSGEMILNQARQARLFAIANGAALYGEAGQVGVGRNYGAGVTMNVEQLKGLMADGAALAKLDVRMKVKGRELVGVVANETRQNRRRSNIKI
mgnify:FL=1